MSIRNNFFDKATSFTCIIGPGLNKINFSIASTQSLFRLEAEKLGKDD